MLGTGPSHIHLGTGPSHMGASSPVFFYSALADTQELFDLACPIVQKYRSQSIYSLMHLLKEIGVSIFNKDGRINVINGSSSSDHDTVIMKMYEC